MLNIFKYNLRIFPSIYFFSTIQFVKKKYQVLLIYNSIMNREHGKNNYFNNLIQTLDDNNISYKVFEEFYFNNENIIRDKGTISFDIITLLNIFFRRVSKFFSLDLKKINKFIFRNLQTDCVITMGQTFVNELSYIYKKCNIFDLQHGILFPKHSSLNSLLNYSNFHVLLYGDFYKNNISRNLSCSPKKLVSIGHPIYAKTKLNFENRLIILITSSIVNKGFYKENNLNLDELIMLENELISSCLKLNNSSQFQIYFKPHPRVEKNILAMLPNLNDDRVTVYYENYNAIMNEIFINISIASTSIIDFSAFGIPSYVALKDCSVNRKFNEYIFFEFYKYPLTTNHELEDLLNNYCEEENTYINDSKKVYEWYWENHKEYDQTKFLDIIHKK